MPGGLVGGVAGDSEGDFLFGIFFCALGRAPNFWKYKLQVVDSSMRWASRHFKTSTSLRTPPQSLCASGPHDARRMLPIVAGGLTVVAGAGGRTGGFCAVELGASLRARLAAIISPHAADSSRVWAARHRTSRPPPGCTPIQNRCRSSPHIARTVFSGQTSSWSSSNRRSLGSASATKSSNDVSIMSRLSRSKPTLAVIASPFRDRAVGRMGGPVRTRAVTLS